MIGWIIVGSLVAIILFILFSSIKIKIFTESDGKLNVTCRFLFFKLFDLSDNETDEKESGDKATDKQSTKKKFQIKKYIKSYDDVIELLHSVKNILTKFKALIKHLVIKNTDMDIVVVGKDAASTAIVYGAVCSAVYPILTLLSACVTFEPKRINVKAGFTEKEMSFSLKSDLKIRLIYLIKFLISAVFEILKLKKELDQNGRT